jgi:hypothetical protein
VWAAIGGLVVGWPVTHLYHLKSSREQRELFRRIPEQVRDAVLKDPRGSLSVPELNALLRAKVIDPRSEASLPYRACPQCGSADLGFGPELHSVETETDGFQYPVWVDGVFCKACQWKLTLADRPGIT